MRHVCYAFVLFMFAAAPAAAQVPLGARAVQPAASDGPRLLHVTDVLNSTPEAQQSLAEFHQRKALGLLPARKTSDDTEGDVLTFKVVNFETEELDDIDFEMVATDERFQLWVESAVLADGTVDADVLTELQQTLGDTTPQGSIDPGRGIIANDEAIFGDPPNVDGDEKTDILLLDIRDGCSPGTGCFAIGGFFYSGDLSSNAASGNQRDIIYLDAIVANNDFSDLALTAAHEYQHLIFANYPKDLPSALPETKFVNEGLSEWAEIANGYPQGRSIRYLGDVEEYNVPLLRFHASDDSRREQDYQRARMWTTYLAQLVGTEVGRVSRDPEGGYTSYRNLVTAFGLSLEDVLLDFHTANLLNDPSLDPDFGHTHSQHESLHALPAYVYDGRLALESPLTSLAVDNGGVQYVEWAKVKDLNIQLEVTAGAAVLEGRMLKVQDGMVSVEPFDPSVGTLSFSGVYDRVALIIAHVFPKQLNASLTVSASWQGEQVYESQSIAYDSGLLLADTPVFIVGESAMQASRFDVPPGGILSDVAIAPYYQDLFDEEQVLSPDDRDYTLVVWDDNDGVPGDVLFELDVDDPPSNSRQGATMQFSPSVDLEDYREQLSNLPDVIYIGMKNTGTDANYLYFVMSESQVETNTSFLIIPNSDGSLQNWAPVWQLTYGDEDTSLEGATIPVRATFLTPAAPVANEDQTEVPEQVVLHANYPNPFNPATTIGYDLPRATDVRLVVYDVLGREVAVLVDGPQVAGGHQVAVDARRWASGLYVYAIEAAGERQVRRMLLVK